MNIVERVETGPPLAARPVPSGRNQALWLYFSSFIALGLVVASLGPTLPGLAAQTGSDLASVSVLFVARSLGYLTGTTLGGLAFDRVPGHRVLAGVLAAMVAAMALIPQIPVLWAATGALAVLGVTEGMLDIGGNTLIVWEFRERVGPRLNALHASFGVGAFLSPLVVAAVASVGGVSWAYRALAIAILPLPFWLAKLSSPRPTAAAGDSTAMAVDRRLVALIALFFVVYVGTESAISGWVYTYTVATGLGGPTTGAYLTSAFWGALAFGRMVAVPVAGRFEPIAIMLVGLACGIVSVSLPLVFSGSVWALWAGTLGAGASLAPIFPTGLALAGRHLPVRGTVSSWFFAGASISGMGLPWVIGQFFERIGPSVAFSFVAVDLTVSLAVLVAISLYLRRKDERARMTRSRGGDDD